jgi:mono/diheme cytochrome c family protein
MTLKKFAVTFALGSLAMLGVGATTMMGQSHVNSPDPSLGAPSVATETSNIGGITGHAEEGKHEYRRFCIGCHGPDGNGQGMNAQWIDPQPRNFTQATFKCRSTPTGTLPTDEDLFNAITRGFVTTNMPPWRPLNPQQRADLVAFIKTWSPRWAQEKPGAPITIPPETPDSAESVARGKVLYQTTLKCFECHGTTGMADGPSASTLRDNSGNPIKPYNFVDGTRFKCGTTNQDLYRILMTGLDGTPMPAWSDFLDANQAWDLIHYVRTLQPNYHAPQTAKASAKPKQQTGE